MDELEIAGKQYISTRRAGRENGYHSDYIGQLIRGGKVIGQKVGRSWYVDAASLATYLGKEYTTLKRSDVTVESLDTIPDKKEITLSAPAVNPEAVEQKEDAATEEVQDMNNTQEVAPAIVTKEMAEEKKPPAPEEYPVVIHKAEPVTPEQAREEKIGKSSGLIYVHDDSPLLPQVRAAAHAVDEDSMPMAEAAVVHAPRRSTFSVAKGAALASMVGLAAVLGAGVAAYLSSAIQVAGDTANAYYSLDR